ncbi:hypothetical protein LNP05_24670 [Klebsiella pneumoniae subsp. pneumoniae]|nr:hypothetical protein [Klebsiella pneumoniae subsp. pneumoniae]
MKNSNAAFDIVYADVKGEKKAISGLRVRLDPRAARLLLELVRQRRLAVAVRSKDLQEGEESLDLQAGQIGKVSFPVEWGDPIAWR